MDRLRFVHILIFGVLCLPCIHSCGKVEYSSYQNSEVIARIADRVITKSELLMRAEYTPRPAYCRDDNYIHKKIVLNSLIAEKLLALALETDPNFKVSDKFLDYLSGRKEQAMRQIHQYEFGIKNVSLSDATINKGIRDARREYKIHFFTIRDTSQVTHIDSLIRIGFSIDSIFVAMSSGAKPTERRISWFDDDHRVIRDAIFSDSPQKGAILPPIRLGNGEVLVVKILDWEDRYSLSKQANRLLFDDVVAKIETRLGNKLYDNHVANLMKGKSFNFEKETFQKLVEDLATIHRNKNSQKEAFLNQIVREIDQTHVTYTELEQDIDYIDNILFTFDQEIWTVGDFYKLLARHPLIFRDARLPMSEFANQVRVAIADILRDLTITQEAYALGFDDWKEVRSQVQMWSDSYLATIYKDGIRASMMADSSQGYSSLRFIEKHMNPLIDGLQISFSDQIQINFGILDSLKLTNIDMFVAQEGVAFPIVVPPFPQLTTDNKLDYGKKLVLN